MRARNGGGWGGGIIGQTRLGTCVNEEAHTSGVVRLVHSHAAVWRYGCLLTLLLQPQEKRFALA